jgi:hypothetical protein
MGCACGYEGDKESMHSFGGETSWKTPTWMTKKKKKKKIRYKDNIKTDLTKTDCENGRVMELVQYHLQWQDLVLAVLTFQLPECHVILLHSCHQE